MIDTAAGWIEIATLGPEDGRPLIMIDHAMASWTSFHHIGRELVELDPACQVVTWSRPGCGKTPPAAGASDSDALLHEARVILPALMRALGIGVADFLGHSEGATVALMFASLFPDSARRVISLAPCGFADRRFVEDTQAMPAADPESGIAARLSSLHADPAATYHRWRQRRMSAAGSSWSALDLLKDMTAPLLLIQGTADEFNSPEQMTAIADAVSGPVDWVMLRNQGHFLHHDVPHQIASLVTGHLQDRRRPKVFHS
jgi:pimeloyl-ACP methyl ester carboxylesterase